MVVEELGITYRKGWRSVAGIVVVVNDGTGVALAVADDGAVQAKLILGAAHSLRTLTHPSSPATYTIASAAGVKEGSCCWDGAASRI